MSEWTTRLAPEITRQFGVEELHDVCFLPRGWPGKGPTVSLGIPECELQYCLVAGGGTLVTTVNRPTGNLSVKCPALQLRRRRASRAGRQTRQQ
jgi:hypothetical protein